MVKQDQAILDKLRADLLALKAEGGHILHALKHAKTALGISLNEAKALLYEWPEWVEQIEASEAMTAEFMDIIGEDAERDPDAIVGRDADGNVISVTMKVRKS